MVVQKENPSITMALRKCQHLQEENLKTTKKDSSLYI